VVTSAALKGISAEIIEAARVDGANAWQVFSQIQIPMVSSTITVIAVTMIIFVIKLFDLILVMGGTLGGPFGSARVIAFTQYLETFMNGHLGYGSAIAVMMMILVLPIILFNLRQFRREEATR
jgi:alpha-glucoside transport system permease protein